LDVTPLSLGIETLGGIFTRLIERNTTIPTKKSQIFSTAADNQTAVTIRVFQGERDMANDNKLLGQFDLVGIPPAPRGIPQVEVTFDIDANGIVHVSAKDMATQKEQSIKITASSGLSKEEVEQLVKEAQSHTEEDKKKRELVELKNQADSLIYSTEKNLSDHGDKIGEEEKTNITTAIDSLRKSIEENDLETIKTAMQSLTTASHKLAEEMYKKASEESASAEASPSDSDSSGPSASGETPDGEEKVVDAEFEEVDKGKG
jgi:molecular chaperone DnaK